MSTTIPIEMQPEEFVRPSLSECCGPPQNVGATERWMSILGGAGLIVAGIARKTLPGLGLAAAGGALIRRGITGHCDVYRFFGINEAGFGNPAVGVRAQRGYRFETSVLVNRSPADLFRAWHNFETLPQIMRHLVSVTRQAEGRTHWIARGPFGRTVEWDAEIVKESEPELIAWRSIPGSQLDTAGSVHFTPVAGRGTSVKLSLKYDPPGGKPTAMIAHLLGQGLEQSVREDLLKFKQFMETHASRTH